MIDSLYVRVRVRERQTSRQKQNKTEIDIRNRQIRQTIIYSAQAQRKSRKGLEKDMAGSIRSGNNRTDAERHEDTGRD